MHSGQLFTLALQQGGHRKVAVSMAAGAGAMLDPAAQPSAIAYRRSGREDRASELRYSAGVLLSLQAPASH